MVLRRTVDQAETDGNRRGGPPTSRRLVSLMLGAALVLAACGDDEDTTSSGTTTSPVSSETTSTDVAPSASSAPTSTALDGTGSTSTTGTDAPPSTSGDGELAGERIDLFPYEGAEVAVVGVAADDTLNVRAGPGEDMPVLFELAPLERGLTATGHNRTLDGSLWSEITTDGRTGWVNSTFLAHLGRVDDVTAQVAPTPADRPSAPTVREVGELVAQGRVSVPPLPDVVVVDAPTEGDVAEITLDLTGFADDAQRGERLHVFAERNAEGDGYTLRSVESTALCTRGVTPDGLCV